MRMVSRLGALGLLTIAASAAAKPPCPTDIQSAWAAYVANPASQRALTADPVTITTTIDAQPEPRTTSKRVSTNTLPLPIARIPAGHTVRFQSLGPTRVAVIVNKPDTDDQTRYIFERSACWRLVERNDEAL